MEKEYLDSPYSSSYHLTLNQMIVVYAKNRTLSRLYFAALPPGEKGVRTRDDICRVKPTTPSRGVLVRD